MSDILKSVSTAFDITKDTRIQYHIAEKGSSSLLTGIWTDSDPTTEGFYKKPDITGDGSETKIALIYGEVMITPSLIDVGQNSSTNDPASILKTYRFIAGEGTNSGVVTGPNGSPLENIYVKDPNGIPQPIVNSDGRPSFKNVLLASTLGAAITSAPKIWDAITAAAPSSAQSKNVDPVTGKPLQSATEKAAAAVGANLPLGGLSNVDETGKGKDTVLVYDSTRLKWVPKSLNPLLGDAFSSTSICGGDGGAGGSSGSGGGPLPPGYADPSVPQTTGAINKPTSLPIATLISSLATYGTVTLKYVDDASVEKTIGTLSSAEVSSSNQITTQTVCDAIELKLSAYFNCVASVFDNAGSISASIGVSSPEKNFNVCPASRYLELKIYASATEITVAPSASSACGPCSTKNTGMQTRDVVAASTANISVDSVSTIANTVTNPTVTADFTRLSGGKYWLSQINVTAGGSGFYAPVTFYAQLGNPASTQNFVNGVAYASGGAITSIKFTQSNASYASSTTGVSVTSGFGYNPNSATPAGGQFAGAVDICRTKKRLTIAAGIASIDGVTINTNDLFLLKDQTDKSQNGIYQKTSSTTFDMIEELSKLAPAGTWCHVTGGTVNASKDFELYPTTAAPAGLYDLDAKRDFLDVTAVAACTAADGSGGGGGSGATGTCTTIDTVPTPLPTISLGNPCSKKYGTQTTPPHFDAVTLPTLTLTTAIAGQDAIVLYAIDQGVGVFQLAGAIPGTVTSTIGTQQIELTGPITDIMTASAQVQFVPDDTCKGEITYTVTITNSDGTVAGTGCTIVSNTLTVTSSQSAQAKVCVDVSSSGGTGKVKVTFNSKTLDLTSGFVAYSTSIAVTAAAIASNINANVAIKNALAPSDATWLPNFHAVSSAGEVTVTAPAAGGEDFNGITLSTEVTGAFVFGSCNGTFLGGITKNIADFLKNNVPNWDKVSNVLLAMAGNVAGAVITNVIMNNTSNVQISIPTTEDVDVAFLYRGRIVKVPNEYDATARTGHPATYAAFSGVWKQQYTNNPAWCLYDFIINKKYGMGNDMQLTTTQMDALLTDIFRIGYYCDDVISSKPRFSLNTVITDGTKMDILGQLTSNFFGGYCFVNGGLRITIDKPETEIKLVVGTSNAAKIQKNFNNSRNFVNKVRLSYVEPSNFYSTAIVSAEVTDAITTYGEKAVDIIAFGCTDADQALRYAEQVLNSELKNTVNISYDAGLDHYMLIPGDVVELFDQNDRMGTNRMGRIISQSGANLVLDRPGAAVSNLFSLTLSDGTVFETTVASASGVNVTLASAPPVAANAWATFIYSLPAIGKQLFRVIKIEETSSSKYSVVVQRYRADKY